MLQGHLLWLEVGMATFEWLAFDKEQRFFDFRVDFLFDFVSRSSRLLFISRARHVLYGDLPLI